MGGCSFGIILENMKVTCFSDIFALLIANSLYFLCNFLCFLFAFVFTFVFAFVFAFLFSHFSLQFLSVFVVFELVHFTFSKVVDADSDSDHFQHFCRENRTSESPG